jgi:hypothetical protein
MPTSTQVIAYDAGANAGSTSKNYASIKTIPLSSSPVQDASLYAPVPFALGSTIVSATLNLYQTAAATGGTRTLTVRRLATQFVESTLTYANRPGVTGATATVAQGNGGVSGRVWALDVTAHMQEVSSGAPWYGFRITSDIATLMSIYSSENTTFQPTLTVNWTTAPQTPTNLSPAGGRAVSVGTPTFRFDFVDTVDDSISGLQIQYDTSSSFVSPTFDTGMIAATQNTWTPVTSITVGTTTFWRVRTRDQSGLISPWSVPVSFVRTAKGSTTITNPAVSPNNYVTEATPPITATHSLAVSAFQIFITDPTYATVFHDSGKITNSTIAYTLPAGVLTSTAVTYRVTTRVWDTVVREATAGDPPYVDTFRDFTFNLSGTVTPVSSLAIGAPGISHGAVITWTRATAPDAYVLRVDGLVTGPEIVPSDVFVSGTSYAFGWYGATPKVAHVVEVLAVVNGVTSASNPTVNLTTVPEGVWLSTEQGGNPICLTGEDMPTWGSTELSQAHQAVGSPYAVVRTQTLGSAQGSYSGWLNGAQYKLESISLDTWRTRAKALGSPAGQKLRLCLTDTNIPVYISNLVVEPATEDGDVRVSFNFYERPA